MGPQEFSPQKPDMDYNQVERQFQEQRRREYNEFISRVSILLFFFTHSYKNKS